MCVLISFVLDSLSLAIRMFLVSWYRDDVFRLGVSSSVFRKKKEGQSDLVSAVSQVLLT